MVQPTTDRPVRVGVFSTTTQAVRAIDDLLKAGFAKDEISVLCSDQRKEELFAEFPHPPLPTDHLQEAVVTGGAIGAGLGGLAAITAADRLRSGDSSSLTAGLLQLHADRVRIVEREQHLCERFAASHPRVPTAFVPALAEDVHDLDGLRTIGEALADQA